MASDPAAPEESIGDLFHQLVADARDYVAAEVKVLKEMALARVGESKVGIGLIAAGAVLALGGLIALLVALVLWLAPLIGPVGAGLAVLVGAVAIGGVLIKIGAGKLSGEDSENGTAK